MDQFFYIQLLRYYSVDQSLVSVYKGLSEGDVDSSNVFKIISRQ